jgi:tetratricopeptide (TPR) repeat protein
MIPNILFDRLLEHYENGRYDDAEKLALSITQEFPKHPFGWKILGAVLGQTGRNSEAVHANQKAVELAPHDAEAHNNLGNTLKQLGKLDEAEARYTRAIAVKPDYAEAHYNLGTMLQKLGRSEEAKANLRQAIALNPNFAEAHNNFGNTLKQLGRLDEAEASYTQAIELKPDFAEAHSNLGNTLKDLRRLDEAEAILRQAIELKPDYAEAHYNLGLTLKQLDRLDEAVTSYRQAIALKSDFAEAHYNLGIALKELGRLDESEASSRQAISLNPDFAEDHSKVFPSYQIHKVFPVTKGTRFIHEMVGAYPKQSCTNIIDFFGRNLHLSYPGIAGTDELYNLEISLDIDFVKPNPNGFGLENTLVNAIIEYKRKFPLIDKHIQQWKVSPICQLMRYEPNNYYHSVHCENDGINEEYSTRVFAWMIYLNDIKDGGGTHFVHQNYTAKPIAGNFYIWPAGWTHMHHGVNAPNETKYIITGWMNFENCSV